MGLQNLDPRFESGCRLQDMVCRGGGMVDAKDLKSFGLIACAGSSPALGTKNMIQDFDNQNPGFSYFNYSIKEYFLVLIKVFFIFLVLGLFK